MAFDNGRNSTVAIDLTKIDYFTEEGSVDAVNSRTSAETDERLAEVWSSLVKHLHAFAKEVDLKQGRRKLEAAKWSGSEDGEGWRQ